MYGGGSSGCSIGYPWNIGVFFFVFFFFAASFFFSDWLGHKYPILCLYVCAKSCPWGQGLCY